MVDGVEQVGSLQAQVERIRELRPLVYVLAFEGFVLGPCAIALAVAVWRRKPWAERAVLVGSEVTFLENDAVDIGGARFVGCTLWTDFDLFGQQERERAMQETGKALNDYRRIKDDSLQSLYWAEAQESPYKLVPEHTR